ncbi:MAG: glutathione S-transferase N-terminal domain-containing protein [Chitinophagaceae bacterium]|nr:glutathione S-transferase N-terminal domain-containing protein [Oligoflexus sp.]
MSSKIQLYSLATPNGQKASVALEEMGIPYDAHLIDFGKDEQHSPEFLKVNPNGKIPAIVDPESADGKPLAIMESGAILIYLAEKSGKFLSTNPRLRSETLQWLFFQVGGVGPMFGQFGHFFKFAKDKCKDPYPIKRYTDESRRILGVLDQRLNGRTYLVGDEYSIADMANVTWVHALTTAYDAAETLGLKDFSHVAAWVDRIIKRPKTAAGLKVCGMPKS